jgi:hypothetical protein
VSIGVILDFNRKFSGHVESISYLFVGVIRIQLSEGDPWIKQVKPLTGKRLLRNIFLILAGIDF